MKKSLPQIQKNVCSFFLVGIMTLFISLPAFSATYYSRQSGNWNDVNSWSLIGFGGAAAAALPGAGDDVIIDRCAVTISNANVSVLSVLVTNANSWSGVAAELLLINGRKLTVNGNMNVTAESVSRTITLSLSGNNTELEVWGDLTFTRVAANFWNTANQFILNDASKVKVHGDYNVNNLGSGPFLFQQEVEMYSQSVFRCMSDVNWNFTDEGFHAAFLQDNTSWQIDGSMNIGHSAGEDVWIFSNEYSEIIIDQNYTINIAGQGGMRTGTAGEGYIHVGNNFNVTHPTGESFILDIQGNSDFDVDGDFDMNWTGSSVANQYVQMIIKNGGALNVLKSFIVTMNDLSSEGFIMDMKYRGTVNVGNDNGLLAESATIITNGNKLELKADRGSEFNVYGDFTTGFNGVGDLNIFIQRGYNYNSLGSQLHIDGDWNIAKTNGQAFVIKAVDGGDIFVGGNFSSVSTGHEMGNMENEEIQITSTSTFDVNGSFSYSFTDNNQQLPLRILLTDDAALTTGSFLGHNTTISLANGSGISVSLADNAIWQTAGNFIMNSLISNANSVFEVTDDAKFVARGNVILNNAQNNNSMIFSALADAVIDINGNIDMTNINRSNGGVFSLSGNSKLEFAGNLIKDPVPNNYGKIQVTQNGVIEFNGSGAQTIPSKSGAGTDVSSLGNVVLNNSSVIHPQFTIALDAEMKSLVVNNFNELEILSDASLDVSNRITNNGKIIVENNGSLVQTHVGANTNAGNGSYKIKRTGKNVATVYNIWSSPIQDASLMSAFNGNNACDMYVFQPSNQSWSYDFAAGYSTTCGGNAVTFQAGDVILGGNGIMDVARGYYIPGSVNSTRTFTGDVNNGNIQIAIETTALGNNANWNDDDWNLVGNPYPSALNAAAFWTENAVNNARITDGIYYWDDVDPNAVANQNTDYAYWNMAGGVSSGNSNKIPNGHIASGQGFWVYANANTNLVFNNAMRSTTNDQFFKQEQVNENHNVWISLTTPSQQENNILVGFNPNATDTVDDQFDAHKLEVNPHVYFASRVDSQNFVIQSLAPLSVGDSKKVPLTLKTDEYGMHTIKAYKKENLSENIVIYVHDKFQGTMHDLAQGDFVIGLNPNQEYTARFELVFKYELKADNNVGASKGLPSDTTVVSHISDLNDSEYTMRAQAGQLHIANESGINGTVQVFDLTGKKVFEQNAEKETAILISNWSGLAYGTYVVTINNQKQILFSQQIMKK